MAPKRSRLSQKRITQLKAKLFGPAMPKTTKATGERYGISEHTVERINEICKPYGKTIPDLPPWLLGRIGKTKPRSLYRFRRLRHWLETGK